MPRLKNVDINYDQIKELVKQLDFEKKVALMREVAEERGYKKKFYNYTEGLVKKYKIPKMSEKALDAFLHNNKGH